MISHQSIRSVIAGKWIVVQESATRLLENSHKRGSEFVVSAQSWTCRTIGKTPALTSDQQDAEANANFVRGGARLHIATCDGWGGWSELWVSGRWRRLFQRRVL